MIMEKYSITWQARRSLEQKITSGHSWIVAKEVKSHNITSAVRPGQ